MQAPDRSSYLGGSSPHLETQVSYRFDVPLVYVKGELDHDSARMLRPVVLEELRDTPDTLLLDFSELTYVDSGGLSLIFEIIKTFQPPRWIGVIGANEAVERLLQMTGLFESQVFRIFPDLQSVSAALPRKKA